MSFNNGFLKASLVVSYRSDIVGKRVFVEAFYPQSQEVYLNQEVNKVINESK